LTRLLRVVVIATLVTAVIGMVKRLDPLQQGLRAEYFPNAAWASPHVVSRVERRPSSDSFVGAWRGSPPDAFSVAWTGAVIAPQPGTYTFATVSDDGSSVYVDRRLVVDNGGHHSALTAAGSIELSRGAHTLLVLYAQEGGAYAFDLLWGRDGSRLEAVPAWALWGRRAGSLARVIPSLILTYALEVAVPTWLAILAVAGGIATWTRLRGMLESAGVWRELRWILGGSVLLNLAGIWWGLPGLWAAIETTPVFVLYGLSQRFSHGWFEAYPPLHYYLLAIAGGPFLLLQSLGLVSIYTSRGAEVLLGIYRLVSIAAAAGTVVATCLIGVSAFGRRAGVFAAAIVALMAPFLYYAKTANVDVPYLFWFALSLVFYVRLLQESRLRDYVLFAATATCAICTKDQAYALYLTIAPVIVYESWRANRRAGVAHPLRTAILDRRLAAAAITAAVLFVAVCNLVFNSDGFLSHVRSITGAAAHYNVFDPTLAGRWQLLRLTVHLIVVSMGWPLFVAGVAGVVIGALAPRLRRATIWLAIVIPAYHVGLINVVLYNYDRFMMPVCLILAVFGGLAIDTFLSRGANGFPSGRWRAAAVAAAFAYSLLYAATVDVLMVADSRYTVERWINAHLGENDGLGVSGLHEYVPRLEGFKYADISTVEELRRERPAFFILNADYVRAADPNTEWAGLISGLQHESLGYRLAFRYRRSSPWPWLPAGHPDLVGPRKETLVFSVLRNINPTIEVFERAEREPPGGGSHGR
jgi:hypothetical protein